MGPCLRTYLAAKAKRADLLCHSDDSKEGISAGDFLDLWGIHGRGEWSPFLNILYMYITRTQCTSKWVGNFPQLLVLLQPGDNLYSITLSGWVALLKTKYILQIYPLKCSVVMLFTAYWMSLLMTAWTSSLLRSNWNKRQKWKKKRWGKDRHTNMQNLTTIQRFQCIRCLHY